MNCALDSTRDDVLKNHIIIERIRNSFFRSPIDIKKQQIQRIPQAPQKHHLLSYKNPDKIYSHRGTHIELVVSSLQIAAKLTQSEGRQGIAHPT